MRLFEKFTKSIKDGKLVNEIVHIWEIQKSIKHGNLLNPFIHILIWSFIKYRTLLSEMVQTFDLEILSNLGH
jgi:hypothetical protein